MRQTGGRRAQVHCLPVGCPGRPPRGGWATDSVASEAQVRQAPGESSVRTTPSSDHVMRLWGRRW